MSRNKLTPPVEKHLLWFAGYVLLVIAVGLLTGAWWRPLSSDETVNYLPAITYFRTALPWLPLNGYPFPAPPLALGIQGWMFALFHESIPGLRAGFSTVAALATGWFLFRSRKDDGASTNAGLLWMAAILTFPYFFWNTFTLKYHTFSAGLMLGAMEMWRGALKQERLTAWIAPGLLLTAAMLTTQLCLPLCEALVLSVCCGMIQKNDRSLKDIVAAIVAAGLPVVPLACFILLWHGSHPAAWRSPYPENDVVGFHISIAQWMLGFICLGVWFAPVTLRSRKLWMVVAAAAIPCALIIKSSGLYTRPDDFLHTGMGPASLILRKLWAVSGIAGMSVAGLLAAMGVASWVQPGFTGGWNRFARIYIAMFLLAMSVAVGYLYESYYLLLLVPLFQTASFARQKPLDKYGVTALIAQIMAGTGYAAYKLLDLNS